MKKIIFEKLVLLNTIFNAFVICSILVGGFVWADTNGVWHRAEDVVPGIFGGDENPGNYVFSNELTVNGKLTLGNSVDCVECITQANIKPSNVNSASIADGSILVDDLADGSVSSEKLNLNNGVEVKSGDVNVNGKTTANEFCLGSECHNSWESLCGSWVAQNAIN